MFKPVMLLVTITLFLFAKEKGTIFLTFDDGPVNATAELLPILKKENIKATFFINGFHLYGEGDENEDKSKEALEQLITDGHVVGNHSYDHMLHNCTDGTRSGATYCNEVGKWPVNAYGDPFVEIGYFPLNREKVEALIPHAIKAPNYMMTQLYRLPYTNGWRVSETLHGDALCATTDSLVPWDAQYECNVEKPSESVKNAMILQDILYAAGKKVFGWDVDWGPTNWGDKHPAETMKNAKELMADVKYAFDHCTPATMEPENSRTHTITKDAKDREGKVIILTHDFLFENSSRGKGADINLPKLTEFIKMAKKEGYSFATLDEY